LRSTSADPSLEQAKTLAKSNRQTSRAHFPFLLDPSAPPQAVSGQEYKRAFRAPPSRFHWQQALRHSVVSWHKARFSHGSRLG